MSPVAAKAEGDVKILAIILYMMIGEHSRIRLVC